MTADTREVARERMASLIQGARKAVEEVQAEESSLAGTALFRATWSVSLAAGFLEAYALLEPDRAAGMFPDFAAIAAFTQRLQIAGAEGPAVPTKPEVVGGRRRKRRKTDYLPRVTVRRVLSERRVQVRRRLNDRRRAASA